MNIEEVQEPETTKIYRQNPLPSVADTRKLRKFTDETNMQARNHENSDEICAQPVRHLDLATPVFYYYRKNPKCYHTVWGKMKLIFSVENMSEVEGIHISEHQKKDYRHQSSYLQLMIGGVQGHLRNA